MCMRSHVPSWVRVCIVRTNADVLVRVRTRADVQVRSHVPLWVCIARTNADVQVRVRTHVDVQVRVG